MRHAATNKTAAGNLSAELRTLLIDEIEAARQELMGHRLPSDAAIHHVRQSVKRARATLRLLRASIGSRAYRRADKVLQAAAAPLRAVRDAKVVLDILEDLRRRRSATRTSTTSLRFSFERQRLAARYAALRVAVDVSASIRDLAAMVEYARLLTVTADGLTDVLVGARRTYAKGRTAFKTVRRHPSDDDFHGWRKQTKYLFYQLQLLRNHNRVCMGTALRQAQRLGDLLGDYHDLTVLQKQIHQKHATVLTKAGSATLSAAIGSRLAKLKKKSIALGAQLYKRRPKRFVSQLAQVRK
jgi:CHAD domain-containing protein